MKSVVLNDTFIDSKLKRIKNIRGEFMIKWKLLLPFVIIMMVMSACGSSKDTNTSGDDADDIKVGVLFSLSGEMAVSESGQAKAALLAIDEINEAGGEIGRAHV